LEPAAEPRERELIENKVIDDMPTSSRAIEIKEEEKAVGKQES